MAKTQPKKKSGFKESVIKGAAKGVAKSIGVTIPDDEDSDEEILDLEGSHKKNPKVKKDPNLKRLSKTSCR